jgi:hypothetical protein
MIYYRSSKSILGDLDDTIMSKWASYLSKGNDEVQNNFLVSSDIITINEESVIFDALSLI